MDSQFIDDVASASDLKIRLVALSEQWKPCNL